MMGMVHDVLEYGATGNGKDLCTDAIQRAIDQCSNNGGGVVVVPSGRFLIGTVYLKSNVELSLSAGATLLGSTDISNYATDTHKIMYYGETHMDRCLIFARDAENVSITGPGTIDGQGAQFPNPGDTSKSRPMLIRFLNCRNITMRDVSLINPAAWTTAWLYCDEIMISGIRIHSRVNDNGDGLDFDGCTNVRVSDCSFDNSDDSICLQTSRADRPCKDVVVTNCVFSTRWAGMRIGLLSLGDIERVAVSNCVCRNISDSGLKIQLCEGAVMRNMVFSNLIMHNVPRPVFMTFNRQRAGVDSPEPISDMGDMSGFTFDTMRVTSDPIPAGVDPTSDDLQYDNNSGGGIHSAFIFTGVTGKRIRDIRLSNIDFEAPGGLSEPLENTDLAEFAGPDDSGEIARFRDGRTITTPNWPEYSKLGGIVPAHGVYARHVDGLNMANCRCTTRLPDVRPAVFTEDVINTEEV